MIASTNTCRWLGRPSAEPDSTDSQASREVPSLTRTTRRGASAESTFASFVRAADSAAAALTFAFVGTPTGPEAAFCTARTLPWPSASTTASPPTTGRPR